jgi:hypothetical protein
VRHQATAAIACVFLLIAGELRLFGTDATLQSQKPSPKPTPFERLFFLKSPKPSFPSELEKEVWMSRNLQYNAIFKVTVDHGKIVSVVPSGGNPALSRHLARAVQKTWVADPRMNGTFTLPVKFQGGH